MRTPDTVRLGRIPAHRRLAVSGVHHRTARSGAERRGRAIGAKLQFQSLKPAAYVLARSRCAPRVQGWAIVERLTIVRNRVAAREHLTLRCRGWKSVLCPA